MIIYNGVTFTTGVQAGDNVSNVPSYSLSINKTTFVKNDTIVGTLNTTNVLDGTTLYWSLEGSIVPGYFNVTSGSVRITSNQSRIQITVLNDLLTLPNPSMAGSLYITLKEQIGGQPLISSSKLNISS